MSQSLKNFSSLPSACCCFISNVLISCSDFMPWPIILFVSSIRSETNRKNKGDSSMFVNASIDNSIIFSRYVSPSVWNFQKPSFYGFIIRNHELERWSFSEKSGRLKKAVSKGEVPVLSRPFRFRSSDRLFWIISPSASILHGRKVDEHDSNWTVYKAIPSSLFQCLVWKPEPWEKHLPFMGSDTYCSYLKK